MLNQMITGVSGVTQSTPVQGSTTIRKSDATSEASSDFGSMLSRMASDAMETLKTAEAVSISGVQDKASVQKVVESVMAAEQQLQAAVAVRDKVVAAYLEVSRMTI
jgi:flagellar hook-basal body complex protein FliE